MSEHHIWQTQAQYALENKAEELTEKQWKSYQIDFIMRAILKVPVHAKTVDQLAEFKKETEALINAIPTKSDQQKLFSKDYSGKLSAYKSKLMKLYKLVPDGYYIAIFMPFGIAIGTSLGVAMKNLAIGVSLGLALGIAIGAGLNAKAKKDGKIL